MKTEIKLEKYFTKMRTHDLAFFYFKWLDLGLCREDFFLEFDIKLKYNETDK